MAATGSSGTPTGPAAVLGLGNVLMGDDGFGPYVIKVLEASYEFPPGVSVIDAGTPGLDLAPFVDGLGALVVVDTVNATGAPGTVRTYRRDELLRHAPQPRLSPHDPGLKETLLTLEFAGRAPSDVLLVGVIPASTATGPGLGDAVRAAVPAAVAAVLAELERLGRPAAPRSEPAEPEVWWERRP